MPTLPDDFLDCIVTQPTPDDIYGKKHSFSNFSQVTLLQVRRKMPLFTC